MYEKRNESRVQIATKEKKERKRHKEANFFGVLNLSLTLTQLQC